MEPTDKGDTITLLLWCHHKVDSFVSKGKCVDRYQVDWLNIWYPHLLPPQDEVRSVCLSLAFN